MLEQYEAAIKSLQQQVNVLQTNFQRLVQVHQENHQHLLQAFHMTDAHLWVLKRIQDDQLKGALKLSGLGEIDYQAYYQAFNEFHRAQIEAAQKAQQPAPEEDGPVEFGGNYGEAANNGDPGEGTEGEGGGEDDGDQPAENPMPPMSDARVAVAEQ